MKNKNFWFGILVMVLVFTMTVVGCGGDDDSTESKPKTVNYDGMDASGNTYTLTVEKAKRAVSVYVPVPGDNYVLKITLPGNLIKKSIGIIKEISSDGTFTLQPSVAGSDTFNIVINNGEISSIVGAIAVEDGPPIIPGTFDSIYLRAWRWVSVTGEYGEQWSTGPCVKISDFIDDFKVGKTYTVNISGTIDKKINHPVVQFGLAKNGKWYGHLGAAGLPAINSGFEFSINVETYYGRDIDPAKLDGTEEPVAQFYEEINYHNPDNPSWDNVNGTIPENITDGTIMAAISNFKFTISPSGGSGNVPGGQGGQETSGEFSDITEMGDWLGARPNNTADKPYNIKLNVSALGGSSYTSESVGSVIKRYATSWGNKYVYLDLSGSTFTNVMDNAFSSCENLTGITLPNTVTSISGDPFSSCTALTVVNIPTGVTGITSSGIFYGCTSLTAINVDPANTSYVSENGILYNKAKTTLIRYPAGKMATSFSIPNSVTTIGRGAFDHETSLTDLTIPDSVTIIAGTFFYVSSSLTSITIPSSVISIGGLAFAHASKLTTINVDAANTKYSSEDGILYNKDKTTLVVYPNGKMGDSFTIPSSVTTIGEDAFIWCNKLTSVTIGSKVTTIESSAFRYSTGFTSVTIPASVTKIGYAAFEDCSKLTSVTFQGIIPQNGLSSSYSGLYEPFGGDLISKYTATTGGGIGTYTRASGTSTTWTKQ